MNILVEKVFELINKANSSKEIEEIIDDDFFKEYRVTLLKNTVKAGVFPQINFQFTKQDVELLKKYFEEEEFKIKKDYSIKDPLAKLLYSLAWKNGDLGKIKHIYNGIIAGIDEPNKNVNQAIVFHQFGKHLANQKQQPIIDQHVIRAYAFYISKNLDDEKQYAIRRIEEITKNHNDVVNSYVKWIQDLISEKEIENERDFIYQVDRLLFAVGKTIKLKK